VAQAQGAAEFGDRRVQPEHVAHVEGVGQRQLAPGCRLRAAPGQAVG
jgi:hypothetical protein